MRARAASRRSPESGDLAVKSLLSLLAPPAALLAVLALPAAAPASRSDAPALRSFSIDTVHSSLVFKVQHMGVSSFYGRFNEVGGRITLDPDDATKCSVTVTVQAASVDTHNGKRDQHLQSPDFFSAKEFPTIEFRSTSVKKAGDGYQVAGQLALHGVTKDLSLEVRQTGLNEADGRHPATIGFETHFRIKRSDFGMDYGLEANSLGDEVEVMLAVEAGED